MSHLRKSSFQLTIIATAVLSLSACSTTNPNIGGYGLDDVGHSLSRMGQRTAELGSSAWEGTKNILHIGPQDDYSRLDEVDLALMEEDADVNNPRLAAAQSEPLLPQNQQAQNVEGQNVNGAMLGEQNLQGQTMADLGSAQSPEAINLQRPQLEVDQPGISFGEVPAQTTENAGEIVVMANFTPDANDAENQVDLSSLESQPIAAAEPAVVQSNDLTHEVTENETLWVIAKATTGDANNWHIIADINDVAPNASVYVGQKITIPADMVKPGYGQPEAEVATVVAAAPEASDIVVPTSEGSAVALNIPEKNIDSVTPETVAAAVEPVAPAAANPDNMMENATALKVGEGETLWDFAKRTTGDATNWNNIAEKNLLSEQQIARLRPGQKIYVPNDMVRSRDANGVLIAKGAEGTVPTATAGGVTPANQEAIDASAAVLAQANQAEEGEIKIVEAAYQDNSSIQPVTAESLSQEAALEVASNEQVGKVMVRGTYYPKAVYNEADFSSSLLMRVSPGTELQVSKAVGPWLEVQTDKGVGYVHSRDIK